MTAASIGVIHTLSESVPFRDALFEFIAEERASRIAYMRTQVRENQPSRVLLIEGEIGLLESLPALLDGYARKHQV